VTPPLVPSDLAVFLGPSLPGAEARRIAPCRVLPPARAGDVLALLPERPLAIALVDGLFDSTPSVWHRELLAALDAGIAVFGAASMGALRAAELDRHGVVGVGRIYRWYRDGVVDDDSEVALLHGAAEHGYRALTVPLVAVRATAEAARSEGLLSPAGEQALVRAGARIAYVDRTWPRVLAAARLPERARERLRAFLPRAPDPKAEDARACIEAAAAFARARRAGAPPPSGTGAPASSHLRRARLRHARTVLAGGATLPSGEVLAALARRDDAGRLAAEGLRHALLAALARTHGLSVGEADVEDAFRAWLARLGVPARGRQRFLASLGLDDAAARTLAEDLALEAALLGMAERLVADGPSWEEGLALGSRLTGAWVEEATRAATRPAGRPPRADAATAPADPPRRPSPPRRSQPRPAPARPRGGGARSRGRGGRARSGAARGSARGRPPRRRP
jgi:hypothetical protein